MRVLLALPAFLACLLMASAANALLVTYTSDFSDGNLSAPLPELVGSAAIVAGGVSDFSVVSSGGNSIPAGDSIAFSTTGRFFRGTSSPSSFPGFATFVASGPSALDPANMSIQFTTADPVTEIHLSVGDLETAGALTFSTSTSAGAPTSVTGGLTLVGPTVSGNDANAIQGQLVWTFGSPVVNPTIEFDFLPAFAFDQTHFNVLYYTVSAIPEPASFAWLAAAFGMVQYGRRGRAGAEQAA